MARNKKRRPIEILNGLKNKESKIEILSYVEPTTRKDGSRTQRVLCKCDCDYKYETTVASALICISCKQCLRKRISSANTIYTDQELKKFVGKKYGRWTITSIHKKSKSLSVFNAKCDCGNIGYPNLQGLVNGTSKSCGCLNMELINNSKITHGNSGIGRTTEYVIWGNMIQRCTNKKHDSYYLYGGRGIKVCRRWRNSFVNFIKDMGKRPEGKTLDRYPNVNGDYKPSNCRWATNDQQKGNLRKSRWLQLNGEAKTILDWSRVFSVQYAFLYRRLREGKLPFGLVEHKLKNRLMRKKV